MLKRFLIPIGFIFLLSAVRSQQPEKILSNWSAANPIEKAYLHFDRDDYVAGQTIWFKAYLSSDFLPAEKSTSLYVEMLNTSSSMISRQVFPVFGGFSRGQIELPDTLPEGDYIIRAYTAAMLNHDPAFVFKRPFYIFGNKKLRTDAGLSKQPVVQMDFFPEGGNLISGLSNSVAFKATDQNGLPVPVNGVVKKDNGETVAEFSAYHDGMGYFDIVAEAGVKYYAVLNNDVSLHQYYLPQQTTKGVVLRIINVGTTKTYEILQRPNDPVFKAAYMVGQMQHHPVFRKEFKENSDEMTGMIQTDKLSSGILHITVFNKDGLPLAERLTFVDNKEYIQPGELTIDTLDFSERAKNRFTLSLKDTVNGSFSIAITDPAYDLQPARDRNIFSGLLLTSDLKGYVHNPAYYFSNANTDSVQNALDLVMMTNGWTRFRWEQLNEIYPAAKHNDPAFISLSGKISLQGSGKPFANKDLLIYIVAADSSRNMQLVTTDVDGNYNLDSLIFFGKANLFINIVNNKKAQLIDLLPGEDSLHRYYAIGGTSNYPDIKIAGRSSDDLLSKKLPQEYRIAIENDKQVLKEVIVTSKLKTPLELLEGKYVSGLFSGYSQHTIDLVNSDEAITYSNIFEYLELKVPGLTVLKPDYESEDKPGSTSADMLKDYGPRYELYYRQSFVSVSSQGPIPMTIYLDEVIASTQTIAGIPAHEIAMIKVFGSFVGFTGGGAGGVLAIYTKKNGENLNRPSPSQVIHYNGYSVIKEFYSPDYTVKSKTTTPDNRTTLYWNPTVFANGIDPSFPVRFYNNDRTRQYKIVIEGMTSTGKLLLIEKLIGGKKAF
ncbi:MAG: hypothetical protein JNN00_13410 [Chitinophagaceae bacterium]|nr:hypothetical protein [Chitinophagaceae bacterium]